jgi:hypothetical protein
MDKMPQLMPDDDSFIFDESRTGKLSAGLSNKFNAYLTLDEVQVRPSKTFKFAIAVSLAHR